VISAHDSSIDDVLVDAPIDDGMLQYLCECMREGPSQIEYQDALVAITLADGPLPRVSFERPRSQKRPRDPSADDSLVINLEALQHSFLNPTHMNSPTRDRIQEASFPSIQEASFPSIQEASFPSIQEASFPSIQEASFPSIQEESFPSIQEVSFPSIQEASFPSSPPLRAQPRPLALALSHDQVSDPMLVDPSMMMEYGAPGMGLMGLMGRSRRTAQKLWKSYGHKVLTTDPNSHAG
jgi:hypothetical protein